MQKILHLNVDKIDLEISIMKHYHLNLTNNWTNYSYYRDASLPKLVMKPIYNDKLCMHSDKSNIDKQNNKN